MAVRNPTITSQNSGQLIQWTGLLNGDTGLPVDCNAFGDRSIQVTGTFGAGGSVRPEGSNDGTTFAQLRDPTSTLMALTATDLKQILECSNFIRPNVTAGDGTTSLTVSVFVRRSNR